jgi:hypothetical protein
MIVGRNVRRLVSLAAGATLAGGALLAVPAASSAASNSPQPSATTWGAWKGCASSFPSGSNCAEVFATAENPNTHMLWVGGDFTRARDGVSGSSRHYTNLLAIRTSAHSLNTSWPDHTFNGTIYALAVDLGRGTLFVGGNFTSIDGNSTGADHVAALDMKSGAVKRSFDVRANDSVRALAYDGSTNRLYIGGRFTAVQGVARTRLASVGPVLGTLARSFVPPKIQWKATKASQIAEVRTLAVGVNTLYVGGRFDTVNGSTRNSIIRVGLSRGRLDSGFSPHVWVRATDTYQEVYKIVYLDPRQGYTGGVVVAQAGHYNRAYRFNIDGSQRWTVSANGDYQAAAVRGGTVYLGGHFSCVAGAKGSCYTHATHYTRIHLAAFNVTTGGIDHTFGPRLSPSKKPYYWGVWTLRVASGGTLWAGGDFRLVKTSTSTYVRPKLAGFPPS